MADLRPAIDSTLRQALSRKPSREVQRRLEALLAGGAWEPQKRRRLLAILALEWIGTAEARQVLHALAKGIPGARHVAFADASHGLPIQHADRVNSLLVEHFAAVGG